MLPVNPASLSYSTSFSILGRDNFELYRRQQLHASFRAKVLYNMEPKIRIHDSLEALMAPKAAQVLQGMQNNAVSGKAGGEGM
jgi:hypothetical protein